MIAVQTPKQAIKVADIGDSWTWTLVDGHGAPTASGQARGQQAAMEMAWRAAKSQSQGPLTDFPDIVVEQPARPRTR
jgi:hypothetical protein